ncbi:MAG: hypothetical protein WD066_09980 [Planctomycetaceae bacterium]
MMTRIRARACDFGRVWYATRLAGALALVAGGIFLVARGGFVELYEKPKPERRPRYLIAESLLPPENLVTPEEMWTWTPEYVKSRFDFPLVESESKKGDYLLSTNLRMGPLVFAYSADGRKSTDEIWFVSFEAGWDAPEFREFARVIPPGIEAGMTIDEVRARFDPLTDGFEERTWDCVRHAELTYGPMVDWRDYRINFENDRLVGIQIAGPRQPD